MSNNSQCPLFEKCFEVPDDGLDIEVAVEVLIEVSLDLRSRLLRLAPAIKGIIHLVEVNGPYMLSI